jgi:hypothetical protein
LITSCQQEGTTGNTIYETPANQSAGYMNRPAPSSTR